MHLNISRRRLAPVVADLAAIIPRRTTIPILADLLLEALESSVVISATNLDFYLQIELDAVVMVPGRAAIPGDTLHRLISTCKKAADINIELKDNIFTLTAGTATIKTPALPADDYPDLGTMALDAGIDTALVPAAELAALFSTTLPAVASDETRYYLCGVYLCVTKTEAGQTLRAVATNGHILITADMPLPDGVGEMVTLERSIIVPSEAVPHILRLLERAGQEAQSGASRDRENKQEAKSGEVEIHIDERRLALRAGDVTFSTKLIDGEYPDYQRVIPSPVEFLEVDAGSLKDAIKLTQIVTSQNKDSGVLLDATLDGVTLRAKTHDGFSATERVSAVCQIDRAIGVNPKYLNTVTEALGAETQSVGFSAGHGALLVRAEPDNGRQAVVMPMRVDGAR